MADKNQQTMEAAMRKNDLKAVLGMAALMIAFAYGLGGAAYLDYDMGFGMYLAYAAACFAVVVFIARKRPVWLKALTLVVFLGLVSWAWVDAGSTRRPFLHDLRSVKAGMAIAQARGKMCRWIVMRDDVRKGCGAISYSHSTASAYNADIGSVYFRHGRVSRVAFSPD